MLTRIMSGPDGGSASFSTVPGATEAFLLIEAPSGLTFPEALEYIQGRYEEALGGRNLSDDSAVFSRLYLSDIENRKECLDGSALFRRLSQGALSVVEQRTLGKGPLSLFSYHVQASQGRFERKVMSNPSGGAGRNGLLVEGSHYRMLWLAGFNGGGRRNAGGQTGEVLESLTALAQAAGMDWLPEGIRTWIYVRDIDNDYPDMCDARTAFFSRKGLTEDTRFLASTGIEGRLPGTDSLVGIDFLGIKGLDDGQLMVMEAPDRLSPTLKYGVTFERGIRVDFGDRSHLYLSGTASIGKRGEVLHAGNVEAQTQRTIENMEALLEAQGASLDDLAYVLVYVRDPAALEAVRATLAALLPADIPRLLLEARVCRPGWLVEIEGMAIRPAITRYKPFL